MEFPRSLRILTLALLTALAVPPASADDRVCNDGFHPFVSESPVVDAKYEEVGGTGATSPASEGTFGPDDLYKLLARYRPSHRNVRALFENARVNPAIREELNQLIAKQPFLSKASQTGLAFRKNILDFIENRLLPPKTSLADALFPWNEFFRDYERFKRNQKNWDEKPMTQVEAERRARQETATRFGLPENFDGNALIQNYAAGRYYRERVQAHTNTDVPQITRKQKMQEDLLRNYLHKRKEALMQKRAQNALAAIKSIAEIERKKLDFNLTRPNDDWYSSLNLKLTFGEIADGNPTMKPPSGGQTAVDLKWFVSTLSPGVAGRERTQRLLLNAWFSTGAETISDAEAAEAEGGFYFTLHSDRARSHANQWNVRRKIENPQSSVFHLSMKRLYSIVASYQRSLGISNQVQSSLVANELRLRFLYDQQLQKQIAFIEEQEPRVPVFEKSLKGYAHSEAERGDPNLFTRLRDLRRADPEDALTGVEWYGNQISGSYWADRDAKAWKNDQPDKYSAPPGETLAPAEGAAKKDLKLADYKRRESVSRSTRRSLYDQFMKARTWVQMVTVAAVMSASVYLPIKAVDAVREGLPSISSSGSGKSSGSGGQGEGKGAIAFDTDLEAHDGENGDPNAVPQVAFAVKSTISDGNPGWDYLSQGEMPQLEALPRNFTRASILEINELDRMIDITREVSLQDNVALPDGTQVTHVDARISVRDFKGYVSIPRPEGAHELYRLHLHNSDGSASTADAVERVLIHPQTGNILAKIREDHTHSGFHLEASFKHTAQTAGQKILDDPRFRNLDTTRLARIADEISRSGLGKFDGDFRKLLQAGGPISVDALSNLIFQSQLYSLRPGTVPKWYSKLTHPGEFGVYARHNRSDTLRMKCDIANSLLRDILREYFRDQKDISIDLLPSWIYNADEELPSSEHVLRGVMTTIGHARTQIRVAGRPGSYVLDATPGTMENGVVTEQTAHYTEAERKEELKDAEKRRKEDQEKERRAVPFDIAPPKRREDLFVVTEAGDGDAGNLIGEERYEASVRRHQQLVQALNADLKRILWNDVGGQKVPNRSFQGTLGGRDMLPPQRMYILGKTLLRFAEDEITLDELVSKMHGLYAQVGISKPADSAEMIAMLGRIADYETALWEKCARMYTKKRKMAFYWADLPDLKQVIFEMMTVAKRYHWQNPKKAHADLE